MVAEVVAHTTRWGVLALLAGIASAQSAPERDAGVAAPRIALLVGIQDYATPPNHEFVQLSGPRNDIPLVRETLISRFGFAPEDVTVLTDAQATHEAIVRAFHEQLIERTGPETEVVFWFCGHGSRVPDRSGRAGVEGEDMDASFLAYDSRTDGRRGSYDIVDDEFHALLTGLAARTKRITLVTDACYSGGGFRGGAIAGRQAARGAEAGTEAFAPELIAPFWPKALPLLDDGDPARAQLGDSYVHLSACSNSQRAWEIVVTQPAGKTSYGALTWFLVSAMRDARPGVTFREVARRAAIAVSGVLPEQSVWFEGRLDRALFDSRFEAPPGGFPVSVRADGLLEVEAGALHGLSRGSRLGVFDLAGGAVGAAEVRRTRSGTAVAFWTGETPEVSPDAALLARETTRPEGLPPLRVYAPDSELREIIESSDLAELADAEDAEYRLLTSAERSLELWAPEGLRIWRLPPGADTTTPQQLHILLEDALQTEVRHRAIWSLAAEQGDIALAASFVVPTEAELVRDGAPMVDAGVVPSQEREGATGLANRAASGEFRARLPTYEESADQGRLAVVELRSLHDHDVHVAVLSVGENRELHVVWPEPGQRDQVLVARGTRRIPIWVGSDGRWPLERPMRERTLVIATHDYVDFSALERGSAALRGASDAPGILRRAMLGARTRGSGRIDVDRRNWGITSVDLLIEPAR